MATTMDQMAKAAEISRKLEEARSSLKRLRGEKYPHEIARWKTLLRDAQRAQGGSVLAVTLKKLTEASRLGIDDATQWWLMAACVELIDEEAATKATGLGSIVGRMMTASMEQRSDAELKSMLSLCKISAGGTATSMSSGGVEIKLDAALGEKIEAELKRRGVKVPKWR